MSIDVEFAVRKDIRNNPVVRDVDTRQKREFRGILLLAGLSAALLLFSAWQHFEIRSKGYEIEDLRQAIEREETVNRRLRLNFETLRAPRTIETRARQEIGLVTPSDRDTIVIERTEAPTSAAAMVALAR